MAEQSKASGTGTHTGRTRVAADGTVEHEWRDDATGELKWGRLVTTTPIHVVRVRLPE